MTPRKEESVYRELTAADLATFCARMKLTPDQLILSFTQLLFKNQADLVPYEFYIRILLPALSKHLFKKR